MARKTKANPQPAKEKKGYSTTQWLALIVVALMALSGLAAALLSGNNFFAPSNPVEPPPLDNNDTTPVAFRADVNTTIADLIPAFKLFATARSQDIDAIDTQIRSLGGVLALQSQFVQDPQAPGQLLYTADIAFSKELISHENLFALIRANTAQSLSAPSFYPAALFEVPKTVRLQNTDLGLEKPYTFSDQLVQGFISEQTQKNDLVLAQLDVSLIGETISQQQALEITNWTAEPQPHKLIIQLPVESFRNELALNADIPYSDSVSVESLQQSIAALTDVNAVEAAIIPLDNVVLTVSSDFNTAEFENVLQGQILTQSFSKLSSAPYTVSFETQTLDGMKLLQSLVTAQLEAQSVPSENIAWEMPSLRAQARIFINETAQDRVPTIVNQIKTATQTDYPDPTIFRQGFVKADYLPESISDPDAQQFGLPSHNVAALLFPDNSIDQNVWLSIEFETIRGVVSFAFGTEIERVEQ